MDTVSPRTRSPLLRRSLIVLLAAVAALLPIAWASPAAAHDQLVETNPADGATVETLPAEISLRYSGQLTTGGNATLVEVTSASGQDATAGEPVIDGAVVKQALTGDLPEDGVYTVTWKVVSSDGHPISGDFSFTLKTAPAAQESPGTDGDGSSTPPANTDGSSASDGATEPDDTGQTSDGADSDPAASPEDETASSDADGLDPVLMASLIGGLLGLVVVIALVIWAIRRGTRKTARADDPGSPGDANADPREQ